MVGSWEMSGSPKVLVAILTRGIVSVKWAIHLRELQLPDGSEIRFYSGMPFDHARNTAVAGALQNRFDYLLFLDDDVLTPPDVFNLLERHNQPIVSGLYYRRNEPVVPVALVKSNGSYVWASVELNKFYEVDMVGAGCLLIRRDVLTRLSYPWFNWSVHDKSDSTLKCSEDFYFCDKARENGYNIFLDTSVNCKHIGFGYSGSDTGSGLKPLEG